MRSTAIGPSTASAPRRARAAAQNPPPGLRSHAASAVNVTARKPSSRAIDCRHANSSAPTATHAADSPTTSGHGCPIVKNR